MNMSPHFTLKELTTTTNNGVDNSPDEESLVFLAKLATHYLEQIRRQFGPLRITSGYRSRALNSVIHMASRDSAHSYGCAADVQSINGSDVYEMVRWVVMESGLDYDQVIDEERGGGRWMHIGILRPRHEPSPRREALVMRNGVYSRFSVVLREPKNGDLKSPQQKEKLP
ncbi:MAG: hypothetical protein A2Y75_01475 [Candidatus Solincola sediminis]|uniref:Peptidase M15A C-terminal domain-containing protein n=1 Tax=Candidatus Solincola sediminis TaxID=1797199 RepID=A0A1F2WNH5_9ACTN|nr:MAG: hypothetical protein A2Y75_01475 [Candidatus Solincola sediminis]